MDSLSIPNYIKIGRGHVNFVLIWYGMTHYSLCLFHGTEEGGRALSFSEHVLWIPPSSPSLPG